MKLTPDCNQHFPLFSSKNTIISVQLPISTRLLVQQHYALIYLLPPSDSNYDRPTTTKALVPRRNITPRRARISPRLQQHAAAPKLLSNKLLLCQTSTAELLKPYSSEAPHIYSERHYQELSCTGWRPKNRRGYRVVPHARGFSSLC